MYQGATDFESCLAKCEADTRCSFATFAAVSAGWCFNAQYCNATNPFVGGTKDTVATYSYTREHTSVAAEVEGVASAHRTMVAGVMGRREGPVADSTFAGVRELASLTSPWFFGAIPDGNTRSVRIPSQLDGTVYMGTRAAMRCEAVTYTG